MTVDVRQEINLYLPSLRPRRDPLAPRWVASYLVAVLLVLSVVAIVDVAQNHSLNERIAELQAQQENLKAEAETLKARLPKSRARELDKAIAGVREQVEHRQRIKGLVDAQNLGNSSGFSRQMEGLSRQIQSGLAIDTFRFGDGGSLVGIKGIAKSAATVPLYVERLQSETAFANSQFGVMKIVKQEESGFLSFDLLPESLVHSGQGGVSQ